MILYSKYFWENSVNLTTLLTVNDTKKRDAFWNEKRNESKNIDYKCSGHYIQKQFYVQSSNNVFIDYNFSKITVFTLLYLVQINSNELI